MDLSSQKIDELIINFSNLQKKNTISEKNLSLFDKSSKTDLLYLSFIDSKDQHYITFLNYIVKNLKPKNIVELGNREGLSTLSLYDAAKNVGADFYSIDIEKDQRYCPPHMFKDSQMHFIFGDVCSYNVINQLPKKIDILFTDTLHYDFQLRDEWEIYQHLLADNALIVIDDININDKRKLFDEVNFEKRDLTDLCHANGFGLFLFKRTNSSTEEQKEKLLHVAVMEVWERKYNALFAVLKKNKNDQLLTKIKKILKKIKPFYLLYTKIFNLANLKLNKGRKIIYGNSIRM
jgi:predicted O-methyltransferase YrrM